MIKCSVYVLKGFQDLAIRPSSEHAERTVVREHASYEVQASQNFKGEEYTSLITYTKPTVTCLVIWLMSLVLSGCSAYRNKFDCDPATGAHCMSVEEIHAMLQNGKIWDLNSSKQSKEKCKGKNCSEKNCRGKNCIYLKEEDRIASFDGILKVWIPEEHRMKEYKEGEYWYLLTQEYAE